MSDEPAKCEVCGHSAVLVQHDHVDITSEPAILGFNTPGDTAPLYAPGCPHYYCAEHAPD